MLITLDFETAWDSQTFTLSKMSTEAYVRDPRFEALLLSIAVDDGPVNVVEYQDISYVVKQLSLDNPSVTTVAHNASFDCFILNHRYGKFIANPICTRAMSRWHGAARLVGDSLHNLAEFFGLPEKQQGTNISNGKWRKDFTQDEWDYYKWYCGMDTELTRMLYNIMLPYMTPDIMQFISLSEQMYIHPQLRIDYQKIIAYEQKTLQKYAENRQKISHLFNFRDEAEFLSAVRSPKKFPQMLEALDCPVPMKFSPKKTKTFHKKAKERMAKAFKFIEDYGQMIDQMQYRQIAEEILQAQEDLSEKIMTPATSSKDVEFLQLKEHIDERVQTLVMVKLDVNSPLQLSRARTFKAIAERGTMPVPLQTFKAKTGRYGAGGGGDGVNFQNLDSHRGDNDIQKTVIAPDGYSLVGADSSQIEARLLGVLANQYDLVQAFANKEDVYCNLAEKIYGIPSDEIRYWAKGEGAKQGLNPERTKEADGMRFRGKTGVLSAGYGTGYLTYGLMLLMQGVWLAEKGNKEAHYEEARRHIRIWRNSNPATCQFWEINEGVLALLDAGQQGWYGGPDWNIFYYDGQHMIGNQRVPGIMLPDGYWLTFPNLRRVYEEEWEKESWMYDEITMSKSRKKVVTPKYIHGSSLVGLLTQGVSFSILRWQAVRFREETGYPLVLNVHDQWVSMVLDHLAQHALDRLFYWMKQIPPWFRAFIPLDCEGGIGKCYADVK